MHAFDIIYTHCHCLEGGREYGRGEGVGGEACGQLLLRRLLLLLPLQLYSNIRHKLSLKMLGKKFSLFRKLLLPFWPTQRAPFPATKRAAATALLLITSIRSVHTHTHCHTLTHTGSHEFENNMAARSTAPYAAVRLCWRHPSLDTSQKKKGTGLEEGRERWRKEEGSALGYSSEGSCQRFRVQGFFLIKICVSDFSLCN